MTPNHRPRPVGSIVGLRPESVEEYRAIHARVVPGVLRRISLSNIRNYSIFLRDGILFSQQEYVGTDYAADMAAIAADAETQKWWVVTDAMQVPLADRAPGAWWTALELLCAAGGEGGLQPSLGRAFDSARAPRSGRGASPHSCGLRRAMAAPLAGAPAGVVEAARSGGQQDWSDVGTLRIFRSRDSLYFYLEHGGSFDPDEFRAGIARALGLPALPAEMPEVFHTDGLDAPP